MLDYIIHLRNIDIVKSVRQQAPKNEHINTRTYDINVSKNKKYNIREV